MNKFAIAAAAVTAAAVLLSAAPAAAQTAPESFPQLPIRKGSATTAQPSTAPRGPQDRKVDARQDPAFRGGVFVAAGDVNGDGRAAARTAQPIDGISNGDHRMLLPAVQKVREAGARSQSAGLPGQPAGDISSNENGGQGLLLPAVQKAREAARRNSTAGLPGQAPRDINNTQSGEQGLLLPAVQNARESARREQTAKSGTGTLVLNNQPAPGTAKAHVKVFDGRTGD